MIGHYKLLEQIGSGSLGDVYRARDTRLGRTVAIKFPPPELTTDPDRREALLRHAERVSRLSHPGIATLFETGEDGERLYLVFEYVPGDSLNAVIGGRPLNARRAIELAIQLADALAEAHADEAIHGNIGPETIRVTPKDRAKLLDFGFAPCVAADAPGADVPDPSSDILALGRVLFEMLTGRQPFATSSGQPAPLPSTIAPGIPAELEPIVARALAPDPQARYQTAATLSAELRGVAAILDIRTEANEAGRIDDRPSARSRLPAWVLLLLGLGVVAGGVWIQRDELNLQWRRWFGRPPAPVLVVVPFDVGGTVPAIVGDGIAEDLAMRLGTMNQLKVVGRSSLRSQRDRDPRTAAREVGAAVALTGTVAADGDRMTLNAAIVEADTGAELWRQTFAFSRSQLLAAEAAIMKAVAKAMGLTTPAGGEYERTASRVVNPRAYDLYFEGRDADSRGDLPAAIRLYEQAIAIDGSLAEGHAALAVALYHTVTQPARLNDEDAWPRLRHAAENAIAADPDLPAAQLAAGLAHTSPEESHPAAR